MSLLPPVITITCGLQLLRVFFPSLAWYLRDTIGMNTLELIPYALGPFLLVFIFPIAERLLSSSALFLGITWAMACVRIIEQLSFSPFLDLVLSLIGVALFSFALCFWRSSACFVLILSLTLDTLIRWISTTLDLSWIHEPWALGIVMMLCGCLVFFAWKEKQSVPPQISFPAFFVGPFLFGEMMLLQHPGAVSSLLNISLHEAVLLILGGNIALVVLLLKWKPRFVCSTKVTGVSLLLFVAAIFTYYASFDIALPFSRKVLFPLPKKTWESTSFPEPSFVPPSSLRVVTYNIHSGFDIFGRQNPEAIARTIETSGADVVALQEMSRGWLMNGSTDLVTWLSHRLKMHIFFQPTADALWGNAILTRLPMVESSVGSLPSEELPLERGYQWVRVGEGEHSLLLVNTHLHHKEREGEVREKQVHALLKFLEGKERVILLGDLNAEPTSREMDLLRDAGFLDAWSFSGRGPGNTFRSGMPFKRIDWMWISKDLKLKNVEVISSTASDHLPVAATVALSFGSKEGQAE